MTTRDEDFVERLIIVNTHEDIMFFTNRGRVYSLKGYEIPEARRDRFCRPGKRADSADGRGI